jgi:hypothetical protein
VRLAPPFPGHEDLCHKCGSWGSHAVVGIYLLISCADDHKRVRAI